MKLSAKDVFRASEVPEGSQYLLAILEKGVVSFGTELRRRWWARSLRAKLLLLSKALFFLSSSFWSRQYISCMCGLQLKLVFVE